jgi:type IV pilus secretin PilQ/predicted competence protein
MSLAERIFFIAALAALLAPGGRAMAAEHGRLDPLKTEMVRTAIDSTHTAVIPAPLKESIARARALSGVRVYSNINTHTITLDVNRGAIVDAYFGDAGKSLNIDLHGVIALPELSTLVINNGGLIVGVQAYLAAIEPQFITRVHVSLSKSVLFKVIEDGDSIVVNLQQTPGSPKSAFNRDGAIHRIEQAAALETQLRNPHPAAASVAQLGPQAAHQPAPRNLAAQLDRLAKSPHRTSNRLPSKLARLNNELLTLRSPGAGNPRRGPSLLALQRALDGVQATDPVLHVTTPTILAALLDSGPTTSPDRTPSLSSQALGRAARTDAYEPVRFRMAQAEQAEVSEAEELEQLEAAEPMASESVTKVAVGSTSGISSLGPTFSLYNKHLTADEDPLRQIVNLNFREMPLTNIVQILRELGEINIMTDVPTDGIVSANLEQIALGRGMEAILRMQGLGIIEEQGIFRITTWEEAVETRRETRMISLKSAAADEIAILLTEITTGTGGTGSIVRIAANVTRNVVILSGPSELVKEYADLVAELDTAPPLIPTVTEPIRVSYAEAIDLIPAVTNLLSDIGTVSFDERSRQLIITDLPVKVEEIRSLVEKLDRPMKQVSIEAMIVDAVMSDDAQTGVDWVMNSVRRLNSDGDVVGNLAALQAQSDFTTGGISSGVVNPINLGGQLAYRILSGDWDISAVIAAEVRTQNAELLASPMLITVENKPARISIAEEVPYQELTQTTTGPPIASTEFKEVGTVLQVTPRVTHDNHIIVEVDAKQSDVKGLSVTGVPSEDKREIQTELRVGNGQTIFIGGLRRFDDDLNMRKTPILGDVPILSLFFKNQNVVKEKVELLIFLTCHILPDDIPSLSPYNKNRFDSLGSKGDINTAKDLVQGYLHPETAPIWKWRRDK